MRPISVESAEAASGSAGDFHLRIHHFAAAAAVHVDVHFAVKDEPLADFELSFEIAAVKNFHPEIAGSITNGNVKDGARAAAETDGAAGRGDFGVNGVDLAGARLRRWA